MQQLKIMFVCHGNICRSPLAEAVLEHMVREQNLEDRILVDSSGVDAYHVGEQSDSRMRRTASTHGVRIDHRSRQFKSSDFNAFDYVFAMDSSNYRALVAFAHGNQDMDKISMFREFDPAGRGDVPDPWYGGNEGFEEVWSIVHRSCAALLDHLVGELGGLAV